MEIPWEDQLSNYSSSINGSPRGKELVKYTQKWRGIWRTEVRSFTMCCFCFPFALHKASRSVKFGAALIKCFCKGTGPRMKWLCCVHLCERTPSWQCPTAALQSFPGGSLFSRFANQKIYFFSFHNSSIFLGCGSLPEKCFTNLRKRYPKVLYLIHYSCLLHSILSCYHACCPV